KKCFVCKKRTPLASNFLCRCGQNFCTLHRYPEAHACTVDYKVEGRKALRESHPVVTVPKLPKI
ncbi:hypothetical protein HELRODRAFT_82704, partial [Helobdella robusta]|uniref:AN1-type domain-containing protein n=1 Tax=Helobdella robusta TaxID=6412 RepID=T1G4V6_HELRO